MGSCPDTDIDPLVIASSPLKETWIHPDSVQAKVDCTLIS